MHRPGAQNGQTPACLLGWGGGRARLGHRSATQPRRMLPEWSVASKDTASPKQPQRELFTAEPVLGRAVRTGLGCHHTTVATREKDPRVMPSTLGRFPCRPRGSCLGRQKGLGPNLDHVAHSRVHKWNNERASGAQRLGKAGHGARQVNQGPTHLPLHPPRTPGVAAPPGYHPPSC